MKKRCFEKRTSHILKYLCQKTYSTSLLRTLFNIISSFFAEIITTKRCSLYLQKGSIIDAQQASNHAYSRFQTEIEKIRTGFRSLQYSVCEQ